jgi:hypothetical protein
MNTLQDIEVLLAKRSWAKHCLRTNIVSNDKIFEYPNFKIALCDSNSPRKKERQLIELIASIAPEWIEGESKITLNRNVQCERHRDGNDGLSWIIWLGDFTGGALVFDDGTRIEEKYKWHQIDGRQYHWNEPHEGTKYAIIVYKSSSRSKSSRLAEYKQRRLATLQG